MTKEDAKDVVEEINKLELKIRELECQSVSGMTLARLYGKLMALFWLNAEHHRLSEKRRNLERLAPRQQGGHGLKR